MSTPQEILAVAQSVTSLADVADRALSAASASRHDEAGPLFGRLGSEAQPLLRAVGALSLTNNAAGQELAGLLQQCVARIARGQKAQESWLRRADAAEAAARVLLSSPAWERANDVCVLLGDELLPLARALVSQGQRRILLAGAAAGAEVPDGVVALASPQAIQARIEAFGPPLPARAQLVLGTGAQASGSQAGALLVAAELALTELKVRQSTFDNRGPVWLRQALDNLPSVAGLPSIASLRGALPGVPAVIVAAGPSLEEAAGVLATHRDRVLVIAVSRAVQGLLGAGVVPDLVICSEAADVSYHLEDAPLDQLGALVLCATANPRLLELPAPRKVTFSANGAAEDWIFQAAGESAALLGGGSVAHMAAGLALELGCRPLIFAGLDLAFRDNRMYAASTSDGQARVQAEPGGKTFRLLGRSDQLEKIQGAAPPESLRQVRGVDGSPVSTSVSMELFRVWFERLALTHPTGTFVNASHGAWIEGMIHRPLEQVLGELGAGGVPRWRGVLEARLAGVDLPARRRRLSGWVAEQQVQLAKVVTLAGECRRKVASVRGSGRGLEALGEAEKALMKSLTGSPFIALMAQQELRQAVAAGAQAKELCASLAASQTLFDIAESAARSVLEPLGRARESLGEF